MNDRRRTPLTDDEVCAIARRLLAERDLPPDPSDRRASDLQPEGTTPGNEARIERQAGPV
jgi:hypothetical protein